MGALRVGKDVDGDEIYAGRAHHEGDILPAKVIPTKNACYIAYNGQEILVDQFEVMTNQHRINYYYRLEATLLCLEFKNEVCSSLRNDDSNKQIKL